MPSNLSINPQPSPSMAQPALLAQKHEPEVQPPLADVSSAHPVQREREANQENRRSLLVALDEVLRNTTAGGPALGTTTFLVSANSTLGRELKLTAAKTVSLDWFAKHQGWPAFTTKDALQNQRDVIAFAPQEPPLHRDYWGLLTRAVPLTVQQREKITAVVAVWIDKNKGGLIENLGGLPKPGATFFNTLRNATVSSIKKGSTTVTTTKIPPFVQTETCAVIPRYGQTWSPTIVGHDKHCTKTFTAEPRSSLEYLLSQPKAIELGKKLEAELGVLPTASSASELVLSALVLSVLADAPPPRNQIGALRLDTPDNFGKSPEAIIKTLDDFLLNNRQDLKPDNVRTMSYLLLSHVAPPFLVQQMPSSLRYGTHEWATFSAAVSRIEQSAPGTSATLTYQQVMDYGKTAPITAGDKAIFDIAQTEALLDWAVTNGRLDKKIDGTYSKSQIEQAQTDFQQQYSSLVLAARQLGQQPPTREQVALDDLKRVFGDTFDFTRKLLQATSGNVAYDPDHFYSLLDVHMSGTLKPGLWRSINSNFSMAPIEENCGRLHGIERKFSEQFDNYYSDLLTGHCSVIKHLFSQLPEQDRRSLQRGEQTCYALRKAVETPASHLVSEADKEASKGRDGVIIRSEYENKVSYYEVFPQQGIIRIRTDLPANLDVGRNIQVFVNRESNVQQPFDWQAYAKGKAPTDGATCEAVLEQIPMPQNWRRPAHDKTPDMSFLGDKSYTLAKAVASGHLIPNKETLRQQANGESALEETQRYQKAGAAAVLSLIPFANTLKHAINGEAAEAINSFIIDGATILLPGAPGLRATAHNLKSASTLFNMLRKASRSTDDLIGLVGGTGNRAKPFYSTIPALGGWRPAATGLTQGAHSTVRLGTRTAAVEGADTTPVLARFVEGKWYPVDAASGDAYGTPIEGFKLQAGANKINSFYERFFSRTPDAPADPDVPAKFQVNVIKAKYGETTRYTNGFKTVKPETATGYEPTMGVAKIEALIANSTLEPEQIGSLMYRRERLLLNDAQASSAVFQREITDAGGTVRGMPQTYYLSQTNYDITGECAALSNTMGLALLEGNQNTLLDNLTLAMADPDAESSARFISNLSNLQGSVGQEATFHSASAVAPISYKEIITDLSNAKSSRTLLVSSTNHGMLAGVKIDPAGIAPKSWFFYDPNFGLASFPSQESMARGLEKTLNSGRGGQSLDAFGNLLTGKRYKVSPFDSCVVAGRFNLDRLRALTQPI